MAEHSIQRSASQSSIPVITPRPSQSSVSSAFFPSQTSLVSQLRRTSESTNQPNPASTSILPQSPPASSIPSFRSIRSLLPFAPAKTSNTPLSPLATPKSSFNFGSLRRITHDKKNLIAHPRPQEPEQAPVIAIARPSETFEEEMMARKRSRDINRPTSDPSPSSQTSDERYVLPLLSPGPPLGADLSTIIEAENSGISKHIPHLGDANGDGDDDIPTSPFNLEKMDKSRIPSPVSRAASDLDLSTSRLAAEVMLALKVEDATTGNEWLKGVNGIVVEESIDDPQQLPSAVVNGARIDEDLDAALDFGALDPDLAELLSPNKINGKSQSPNPVPSRLPSRAHSRSPSQPASISSLRPPKRDPVAFQRTSPRLATVTPPASRPASQSSPTRRSASLSHTNFTRGPPSSLPRLMRSVTTAPPSASDSSDGSSTPSGIRGPSKKRHQPPSPLSSQTPSNSQAPSPASSRGSTDVPPRRLAGSRFATAHRHVSSYAQGNSRLMDPSHTLLPSTVAAEKDSSTRFSPRSASDPARQPPLRPSLEINDPLEVNKRRRPHLFYNRKRSMSVEDAPLSPTSGSSSIRPSSSLSNRPPVEWLGPRTVKAFAAAGLLDGDRDGAGTHVPGPGKYTTLRAHTEREDRFVPSRMAFSEAASVSSWGRSGSVSRGMTTPSEGGIAWGGSPTFSAPRTAFSGSTAPTSISATSSSQQAVMQVMKEKHDLETEALLSALSDSQRVTKTLREENSQLRGRIRELEDELDEMRVQVHRFASGVLPPRVPSARSFSRSPRDRTVLLPSPLAVPRRPTIHRSLSQAPPNGLSLSAMDHSPRSSRAASPVRGESPAPVTVKAPRPRRRRASTSSSVFPNLPQNMSLLMHEDTMHDRSGSSAPPSPPIPQLSSLCNGSHNGLGGGHGHTPHTLALAHAHAHRASTLSVNVSPTIASFSMTEIPGSPSSLQLQPEHELHLGDMASLSLYAMSDEEP